MTFYSTVEREWGGRTLVKFHTQSSHRAIKDFMDNELRGVQSLLRKVGLNVTGFECHEGQPIRLFLTSVPTTRPDRTLHTPSVLTIICVNRGFDFNLQDAVCKDLEAMLRRYYAVISYDY